MKGSGTPCALVLTYGNRAYEDAPRGLGDIVAANGFRIKGVATMASQHTYGQIQLGRPNKDDIAELQEFFFHMLAKAEEPETEFSHARERCSHRCERLKNLVVH